MVLWFVVVLSFHYASSWITLYQVCWFCLVRLFGASWDDLGWAMLLSSRTKVVLVGRHCLVGYCVVLLCMFGWAFCYDFLCVWPSCLRWMLSYVCVDRTMWFIINVLFGPCCVVDWLVVLVDVTWLVYLNWYWETSLCVVTSISIEIKRRVYVLSSSFKLILGGEFGCYVFFP